MTKNIFVAGGAGFIGYHLVSALLEEGSIITAIDNFITGSKSNIEALKKHPNFTFIEKDVAEPLKLDQKFQEIYNLASPASPAGYYNHPLETLKVNSVGTWNLLELAKINGARFIQTSTSEVYGDPLEHPQKETYFGNVNPIGPRSCYDEGKRFSESLIVNFRNVNGTDAKIVRLFNSYGPNMKPDDGRVVSNFINQALNGEDLTIYGDGSQTRSFCYVKDTVKGIIKMMRSDEKGPINIGNPTEISILAFAEVILKLIPTKSKIVYKPLLENDPLKRKPDITLAREKLAWEPSTSLEVGIKETIEYFKGVRKG